MPRIIAALSFFLFVAPVHVQSFGATMQDFEKGVATFESGDYSAALRGAGLAEMAKIWLRNSREVETCLQETW